MCSAHEQSLITKYTKYHVDKIVLVTMSVNALSLPNANISVDMTMLPDMCVGYFVEISHLNGLMHGATISPDGVIENEEYKILWDMNIQCDQEIRERKPDIILLNKKSKEIKIIDIACPGDSRVKDKENEKIDRYQLLKDELISLWGLKIAVVIPVVAGALGCLSKHSIEHLDKVASNIRTEVIQKKKKEIKETCVRRN